MKALSFIALLHVTNAIAWVFKRTFQLPVYPGKLVDRSFNCKKDY